MTDEPTLFSKDALRGAFHRGWHTSSHRNDPVEKFDEWFAEFTKPKIPDEPPEGFYRDREDPLTVWVRDDSHGDGEAVESFDDLNKNWFNEKYDHWHSWEWAYEHGADPTRRLVEVQPNDGKIDWTTVTTTNGPDLVPRHDVTKKV